MKEKRTKNLLPCLGFYSLGSRPRVVEQVRGGEGCSLCVRPVRPGPVRPVRVSEPRHCLGPPYNGPSVRQYTRTQRHCRGCTPRADPHHPRPPSASAFLQVFSLTLMSLTAASAAKFRSILNAAFDSYAKKTGIDLTSHPSADKLQNCHSSEDVLQLLLERETAFNDYRDKYRKLIDCFRPIVQVIHAFSGVLGEAVALVSSAN
jgi:hypothetical protein